MSDIAENIEQVSLVPKRKLAEKFGVCMKTIDRWVEAEILEKPVVINRRDYFNRNAKPKPKAAASQPAIFPA